MHDKVLACIVHVAQALQCRNLECPVAELTNLDIAKTASMAMGEATRCHIGCLLLSLAVHQWETFDPGKRIAADSPGVLSLSHYGAEAHIIAA